MPELIRVHFDDFTLLRYVAEDLPAEEREQVESHLETCRACTGVAEEIRKLDAELAEAASEAFDPEADAVELPEGDPFRRRPTGRPERRWSRSPGLAEIALEASEAAGDLRDEILAAAFDGLRMSEPVAELSLDSAADRFALLYALQEGGRRIAESPVRMLRLAEEVLARLRASDEAGGSDPEKSAAGTIVPRSALLGQAHLLAGQACSWAGDFDRAGSHLEVAYRCFGRGAGDEIGLATVEHLESQRRSFLNRGEEALLLARRAAATFESFGLEDLLARARAAAGIALHSLGRHEAAAEAFRSTVPVFEQRGLWSNAINSLNNLAVSLQKLGRLDEARREYARALRRFSRDQHRSVAFIRHGLAEVLFAAGHYREAALSLSQAVRLYLAEGLRARALTASLFEIESWARSGDLSRARHRLEIFQLEVARSGALDPSVVRQIRDALTGTDPAFERLALLRKTAEESLHDRLEGASA